VAAWEKLAQSERRVQKKSNFILITIVREERKVLVLTIMLCLLSLEELLE